MTDRAILLRYGDRLTAKQLEVLQLAACGMSQRGIALALGLSRSSVQSRIENATQRLEALIREETMDGHHEAALSAASSREERAADRKAGARSRTGRSDEGKRDAGGGREAA